MAEHKTELAALDALLDYDHAATIQLLRKLTPHELQTLADAGQELATLCHETWVWRLAHLTPEQEE
jgi:hypothetical protein